MQIQQKSLLSAPEVPGRLLSVLFVGVVEHLAHEWDGWESGLA